MFDVASEVMQHRPSEETGPVTRRLIMLIFVGWLPPYLYPSGCLPRSRREDLSQPHNVHEGCTITGAASPPRIEVAPDPGWCTTTATRTPPAFWSDFDPRRRRSPGDGATLV